MYDLNMLVVRVYYMNNSLVVVVPTSGRVTRSFVRSFVHTMTTAHDDDGTRRHADERRRDGGKLTRRGTRGTSRRTRTRRLGNGTEVETGRVNARKSVVARHHRSWVQRLCRRGVID